MKIPQIPSIERQATDNMKIKKIYVYIYIYMFC